MLNERDMLLRRLSSAQFAAWETHMFLDTHPNDTAALAIMRKYDERAAELRAEYESKFGPLSPRDMYGDTSFEWLKAPWPWDNRTECDK
jgi:spore coat protein JB